MSGVIGVAPPSPYPSTAVHGVGSSKKISAIRGWTKDDMMKAIDDVEFNGYSIKAAAKKYGIAPTSMHYWLNGLTHTKRKGPLTVLSEQEEAEVVVWSRRSLIWAMDWN